MKPTLNPQEISAINQQFAFTEKNKSKKKIKKIHSKLTKVDQGKMGLYIQLNEHVLQKKDLYQIYLQIIASWKNFVPILSECKDYEIEICVG
ncbi:hypothetical protein [Mesonia aquimarina]|uniref:hypothetical protein n=1 Tax=Mesonia aquimarina TaxID=1504967 RepID=UPI000EF5D4BB|nr:hypothetical protein [Mesonia aquimarina]